MHSTMTYGAALDLIGTTLPDHLVADVEVPILTGPQTQGDVGIIPAGLLGDRVDTVGEFPVGTAGVQVVVGEATGNTHWLHGDPGVMWARAVDEDEDDDDGFEGSLVIGYVTVPDGAAAWLIHTDEHGCNGIGAGVYALTGKREQADVIRRVAD
jgi:hypothetical protein